MVSCKLSAVIASNAVAAAAVAIAVAAGVVAETDVIAIVIVSAFKIQSLLYWLLTACSLCLLILLCNENPIYVFPEKEMGGLSPNFHIHVSESDLHIPRISLHIFLLQNRQTDQGNI